MTHTLLYLSFALWMFFCCLLTAFNSFYIWKHRKYLMTAFGVLSAFWMAYEGTNFLKTALHPAP